MVFNKKIYMREYRRRYQQSPRFKEKRRFKDFARYSLRNQILERDNHKCVYCGINNKLELHHKKYTRNPKDIVTICKKCHLKIHNELKIKPKIPKEIFICKRCNKKFIGRKKDFCSRKCCNNFFKEKNGVKKKEDRRKKYNELNYKCVNCGKKLDYSKWKFCSNNCKSRKFYHNKRGGK